MSIRFKLLAAVLGLAVAGGAAADASAKTVVTKTKVVAAHHGSHLKGARIIVHPRHFGARVVKHVRVVKVLRHAPATVKVVKSVRVGTPALRPLHPSFYGKRIVTHARIVKHVVKAHVAKTVFNRTILKTKTFVRINKAPLQRHAMVHRTAAKTVIR